MAQIGHTEVTQHISKKYGHRLVTNAMRYKEEKEGYKSDI